MIYFRFKPLFYKSDAPAGLIRSFALYSWGCAPRCIAPPQAIVPKAPPAPDANVETPVLALQASLKLRPTGRARLVLNFGAEQLVYKDDKPGAMLFLLTEDAG